MLVKELIAELQKQDPDAVVVIPKWSDYISSISVDTSVVKCVVIED